MTKASLTVAGEAAIEVKTAILAITANGTSIGRRLLAGFGSAELYASSRYASPDDPSVTPFEPTELKALVRSLWERVDGFVFIMASGIVVRIVAGLLKSKVIDPAVIVMDDAGKFSVSLLSGHLGGANALALEAARIIGATPVITTATDAASLPSFDMLASDHGWRIRDISKIKKLNLLLLDGGSIAVLDASGAVSRYFSGKGNLIFCDTLEKLHKTGAEGAVIVTNLDSFDCNLPENALLLHPANLALGIGCNRGATAEEIDDFVTAQLERMNLSELSVMAAGTAEAKRGEAGLSAFAQAKGIPLKFYDSVSLNSVTLLSPPSRHAIKAIGARGVAEPAAVLAADGGSLIMKKVKSGNVTLAIAEKRHPAGSFS